MLNSFELTNMFQSLLKRDQIFFTKEDKQDAIKLLTLFQKEEMEATCSTYYEVFYTLGICPTYSVVTSCGISR